ncbi:unnamed protein product [Caenorhabditis brenneri]
MRKTVRKFSDYLKDNTSTNVSPWDSYLELCNEFGEDFMSFPEFEYRFLRFHSGEKDDFDSSLDTPLKAFSDLPVEIIGMFVKRLWPMDRLILRQVSQDLQSIVDSYSPKLRPNQVEFRMELHSCRINFGMGNIEIKRLEKGYHIEENDRTVIIRHSEYKEGLLNAFLSMLTHLRTKIKLFRMIVFSTEAEYFWLMENVSKSLGNAKIWVKKLVFRGMPLLPFMKLLKPGELRNLFIYQLSETLDSSFGELAETEQWRQARFINIFDDYLSPNQLECFQHFERFDISPNNLTVNQLMEFVKTLQGSKNFQKCILRGLFYITADDYAAASSKTLRNRRSLREPIEGIPDRELELRFCQGCNANVIIQRKKKRTKKD